MRMRVSAAVLRRLERVEQNRAVMKPTAAWPGIMDIDEWEAEAVPMQAELVAFTREYLDPRHRDGPVETDPMDVTHKYKSTACMFGDVLKTPDGVE
jgi:hypothetical protein